MSKPFRWTLATLILFAVIVWVERDLGWHTVIRAWAPVSPGTVAGLTLLTFASYLLRAFRVYLWFGRTAGHGFTPYIRINLLHNALNNLLPMRLGEASFPVLMKRTFNYPLLDSSAGLIGIRLMDLHWLLLLLSLLGCVQFGSAFAVFPPLLLFGPLAGAWLWRRMASGLPAGLAAKAARLRPAVPGSWRLAAQLYGLTALTWTLKLLALTTVMLSFIEIPAGQGLLAIIAADLSSVLPVHGLAGSGTFEGAILAALLPLGVTRDAILLAAVNVHLYLLAVTLLSIPVALAIPVRRARLEADAA